MFSRRVFGGTPDTFKLVLEYGPDHLEYTATDQVRLPVPSHTLEFEFNSDESESSIVERFAQRQSHITMDKIEERVLVKLSTDGIPNAATFPEPKVTLQLSVACSYPALRCIQVSRVSSSGNVSESTLTSIMKHCQLTGVWKVKSADGFGNFWSSCAEVSLWESMRNLNLSHCNLTTLPATIGLLSNLKLLRASHNKLTAIPNEVAQLKKLEVLAVDHNMLATIPGEPCRPIPFKSRMALWDGPMPCMMAL